MYSRRTPFPRSFYKIIIFSGNMIFNRAKVSRIQKKYNGENKRPGGHPIGQFTDGVLSLQKAESKCRLQVSLSRKETTFPFSFEMPIEMSSCYCAIETRGQKNNKGFTWGASIYFFTCTLGNETSHSNKTTQFHGI